jgi:hypothetical protein
MHLPDADARPEAEGRPVKPRGIKRAKLYNVAGEWLTVAEMAVLADVHKDVMRVRVKSGIPPIEAVAKPRNSKRTEDFAGQRYGRLTFIREAPRGGKRRRWVCRCDCGVEKEVDCHNVTHGHIKSCGCMRAEGASAKWSKAERITGQTFADGNVRITGVTPVHNKNGRYVWECECKCGKRFMQTVARLRSGHITSCGCGVTRHQRRSG